jgi:hypothetical protein
MGKKPEEEGKLGMDREGHLKAKFKSLLYLMFSTIKFYLNYVKQSKSI